MNRYGFCVLPNDGDGFYGVSHAGVERGLMPRFKEAADLMNDRALIPPIMMYNNKDARDIEMDAFAKAHPSQMFAPFEITAAIKYPAAKEPVKFEVSNKGVLPA